MSYSIPHVLLYVLLSAVCFGGVADGQMLSNHGEGSWNYTKNITILSQYPLIDYQILVRLYADDFPKKAKQDGSDIRFTDALGKELSYWIESWDYSNSRATIWIKIPSIAANNAKTNIIMYYGNRRAYSSQDGDNTFLFFDDFAGSSIDAKKWRIIGSQEMRVGNSLLFIGSTRENNEDRGAALVSKDEFDDNVAIEMKIKSRLDADPYIFARTQDYSGPIMVAKGYTFTEEPDESWSAGKPQIQLHNNGIEYSLAVDKTFDVSPNNFYWYSAILNGYNLGFRIYDLNRDQKIDLWATDANFSSGYLGLGKDPRAWEKSEVWIDAFLVRQFALAEPSVTLGPEKEIAKPSFLRKDGYLTLPIVVSLILIMVGLILTNWKKDVTVKLGLADKTVSYVGGAGIIIFVVGAIMLMRSSGLI